MIRNPLLLLATALLGTTSLADVQSNGGAEIKISISESSIKVGGTELRSGPRAGKTKYISKKAVEKVFGSVGDKYPAGRVVIYAWPNLGIQVHEGIRGT